MEAISRRLRIKEIPRFMFFVGAINISFIFLAYAIALIGFVFNIPISPYHIILAFTLTALFSIGSSWYYFGPYWPTILKNMAIGLIIFTILLLSCGAIAGHFYDVSFDGQWYHQGAIHLLMNGFNPIYQQAPDNYPGALYIDHYPGAFETISAVIGAFTHHIEDGKLLNIFLIVTAVLLIAPIIFDVFPGVDLAFAISVVLLAALNPISIYQSLSYYVDGASASLLAILVFLLLLSYKKMNRPLLLIMTSVIVLLVNIKFFNLVYAVVLVSGFIAICIFNHKSSRLHYMLVISLLVGLLFGAHPYITSLIDHGTPFYPVNGISQDMIAGDMPPNLAGKNSLEQLVISIFSRSDFHKADAVLKIPFTFTANEIRSLYTTDARTGGFGPLFSGVVLLSVLIAILLMVVRTGDIDPMIKVILPMCVLLLVTVVINPGGWWARYVPQLWLIPLLLLLGAQQRFTSRLKILNYVLVLALLLNICMVAYSYYSYQQDITDKISRQISDIRSLTQDKPAHLYCGIFIAVQDRYKEQGIDFIFTDTPPDRQWSTLAEVEASYGQVTFY
ncbi:hypothetical protein MCP_1702 [Methanocella paludicola SANAE]|uniref:Glycosyltransferase RgtA/B/C/D-like domain-containing protein n=1 Tax=Methanocella paludicola (strain DSM 17711 / JCM 13418 / NBRC 101707 / SANAE) TaxID=304371 RepID=D1YZA2_METPS|nr:hypothetical protein [Methanocella paludicola]BAI61774.1 hypothetical protein MCP_1702 [Methanocella paludicola SANAE]